MPSLNIGTRGSPLALAQAELVQLKIAQAFPNMQLNVMPMMTTGDKRTDIKLCEIGGKGLFTLELERALKAQEIDIAVHSMKDVETFIGDDFLIAAMIERDDPRDVFVARSGVSYQTLPLGAQLGTSSVRRAALALNRREDLEIVTLRGNVQTRLDKILQGQLEGTFLAMAGLKRLGIGQYASEILSVKEFTPAVGQGGIGIQCLKERTDIQDILSVINHQQTFKAISLERGFLEEISGSCGTPVGGHVRFIDSSNVEFHGCAITPDGQSVLRETFIKTPDEIEHSIRSFGKDCRQWLLNHGVDLCS